MNKLIEQTKNLSKDVQALASKYPDLCFVIGVMELINENSDVLLLGDACPVCFAEHIYGLFINGQIQHLRVEGTNMDDGKVQLSIVPAVDEGKKH